MKIVVTTPTRCGLVGGGTDVDPYAKKHGGKILSIALNIRMKVELVPHSSPVINLESMGEKRTLIEHDKRLNYNKDPKFDLVRAVINHFQDSIPTGFYLKTYTDAENVMSLGSSGAAGVAIINAFNVWLERKMTPTDIALLASSLEIEELGWPGGKQDQFAAAFGGINLFSFGPGSKIKVTPQKFSKEQIEKLRDWSMMYFIGGYRHSREQQTILKKSMREKERILALHHLRDSVDEAINIITEGNMNDLGKLLHHAWEKKKLSNPVASNEVIDDFYNTMLEHGALGGKIMGSGGAGNMFIIAHPKKHKRIGSKLAKKGATPVDFDFDFKGPIIKIYK